jgi:hypothetical protein
MCCCFSHLINEASNAIIRVPRRIYSKEELDNKIIPNVKRTDFELFNERREKLYCSLYSPVSLDFFDNYDMLLVIYCHGNAGIYIYSNLFTMKRI